MRILATFPGRAGDILWSLPTLRALSQHFRTPLDFVCCGEFAPLLPLLRAQPYLGHCVARPDWPLVPPAEWQPPADVALGYDRVYHLGYRGWPHKPLPFQTNLTLAEGWYQEDGMVPTVDLDTPWIIVEGPGVPCEIAVGFTEEWFELKLGLLVALEHDLPPGCQAPLLVLTPPRGPDGRGTRWVEETSGVCPVLPCDWLTAARAIRNSDVFLGDCSALHVLAAALGKKAVIVEPNVDRLNGIFWPLGTTGRVRLVTGNDGKPTHDARHVAGTLAEVLKCGS